MTLTPRLRYRPLRARTAVKFVWWVVVHEYDIRTPQTLKVRPLAAMLGLKPRTVRRAIRALVAARYLDPVVLPTAGTPGEYVAGPRAYRRPVTAPLPPTRRGQRGPRPHPGQLALALSGREDCDHAA